MFKVGDNVRCVAVPNWIRPDDRCDLKLNHVYRVKDVSLSFVWVGTNGLDGWGKERFELVKKEPTSFKVGDKVKPVLHCGGLTLGKTYTVLEDSDSYYTKIQAEKGRIDSWLSDRFELVEEKSVTDTLYDEWLVHATTHSSIKEFLTKAYEQGCTDTKNKIYSVLKET
jgi:hypothetical protein